MTDHNPGPLSVHETEGGLVWIEDESGITVCDFYHVHDQGVFIKEQAKENAHLLCNAFNAHADMLESLEMINTSWTEAFPDGPDGKLANGCAMGDDHKTFWKAARAAIAKAKGETS